jgi:hypothetical protein
MTKNAFKFTNRLLMVLSAVLTLTLVVILETSTKRVTHV